MKVKKIYMYLLMGTVLMCAFVSCSKTSDTSEKNRDEVVEQKELTDPRGKTLEDTSTGELKSQIVETLYETKDVVIADIIPTEMGYAVDPTGATDSTEGIQKALYDCHDAGGGTVYLPSGNYAISHSIYVPPYVTLRGDWQDPDVGTEYGTIISVWMDADDSERTGIFRLGSCGGAKGLTIYYPLQTLDLVMPYPYTFFVGGSGADHTLITISDITIINGYRGIGTEYYTSNECLQVDNIKGTFLLHGLKALYSTDVGNVVNFKVNNKYWKEAAADCMNAVSGDAIDAYTKQYTTGIQLGDLDWTFLSNIEVDGCAIGIQGVPGMRNASANAYHGSMTDLKITNCEKGIVFDYLNSLFGAAIAKSYVEGGIYNNTKGPLKLCDVEVKGEVLGVEANTITTDETDMSDYVIDYHASYVKPASRLKVLDLPNGNSEDMAPAVQEALNQMAEDGGGVVYIPGGVYSFQTPITVPAGVELRGATSVATREIAYDFAGTVFLCYYGDDESSKPEDEAFITLNGENAGLNGIRIVYPENSPKSGEMKTTYVVRGKGTGVYVVNSMISGSYYGIDFRNCDNHYIKGVTTCCYCNAFILGGENGIMTGCLQNGTVQARVSTPYMIDGVDENGIFEDLINPVLQRTTEYVIVEGATNQLIYDAFSYGSKTAFTNVNSENTLVNNFGTDGFTFEGILVEMKSGSVTGINMMRLGGNSYNYTSGSMKLYNRLTYREPKEQAIVKE